MKKKTKQVITTKKGISPRKAIAMGGKKQPMKKGKC